MKSQWIEDSYPLSPIQQGMLFHSLYAPQSGVDIEQMVITLHEEIEIDHFKAAWQQVVQQHPILRTAFCWDDPREPIQEVCKDVTLPIIEEDWSALTPEEQLRRLGSYLRTDRLQGFALEQAPLMRLTVIRRGSSEAEQQSPLYTCIWTFHHILLDGRSFAPILNEVFDCYAALSQGHPVEFVDRPPYRAHIEWLQAQESGDTEAYWRQKLAGFTAPTPLVVDHLSTEPSIAGFAKEETQLSESTVDSLRTFAKANEITLNTCLQGAWALLLSRYSSETDVVFGTTRACRWSSVEGANEIIGLFMNTVPMRIELSPEMPVGEWLQQIRAQHIELRKHEQSPLSKVQEWSELSGGLPLFESILAYENFSLNSAMRAQGGAWANREFQLLEQAGYPLTVNVYEEAALQIVISYDKARFDEETITRLLGHLRTLLEGMAANPSASLSSLPLLTQAEHQQLVVNWNNYETTYGPDKCIHELFEAQVARTPYATAVTFPKDDKGTANSATALSTTLTYHQLNRRANQLAHYLRGLGVGKDVMVAMYMERSVEMVIGILGILKAGGAYVPMDPVYPPERVAFMLEDSEAPVILTQESLVTGLPEHNAQQLCLDTDWALIAQERDKNPLHENDASQLAYVIYTSGSTGKPKGVLIQHHNVVRLFQATDHWYRFGRNDVWSLFHSYAFDFSVWELWGALIYGGRLVVVPYWVSRSPEAFYKLLIDEKVTVLNQTPSAFRQLIQTDSELAKEKMSEWQDDKMFDSFDYPAPPTTCHPFKTSALSLRYVVFGGEALDLQSLRPWFERYGDQQPQLVNMYGITETTVHVTYRPITMADVEKNQGSVIGEPIPDLQLYILDQNQQPVPIGVAGEMYIGGDGVANGYLNRAELTADRFIENPFGAANNSKPLYRSGDLARYLPNRDVEYLGRIDHQVKIRGFRIELGEIEAALGKHDAIREVVVLAREDSPGEKRLVAYLIPDEAEAPSVIELREFLKVDLPDYMVPSAFINLEQFPLTNNGKLDRKALPIPEESRIDLSEHYLAPRTPTEEHLAQVWADVLRVERVGIQDNFFELGGDSILSIQIIARAKRVGVQLTPKQIFLHPTVEELAEVAKLIEIATQPQSEQGMVVGMAPLTPIQRWFFEHDFPTFDHWNQAFLFKVQPDLNVKLLEQSIRQVIHHHDALRLRYRNTKNGYEQYFNGVMETEFVTDVDLSDMSVTEQREMMATIANEAQSSFNIVEGPMLRLVHFKLGKEQPGRLLIVIHHLVVDGVSWQILMEDIETVYQALQTEQTAPLPAKSSSFQQWAKALQSYAQSDTLKAEEAYWQRIATGGSAPIPTDLPNGENSEASVQAVEVTLEVDATQALLKQVPAAYNTQINDLLLTALAQAVTTWRGDSTLLIDLEGHGREDIIDGMDLSRTVGWFTSVFPVRLKLSQSTHQPLVANLKSVKEQLRQIPNKGIGYGILNYLAKPQAPSSHAPQIVFNYLGQVDQIVAGSSMFAFANESVGRTHSPHVGRRHLIEIIGQMVDGKLRFSWLYSENIHHAETIERVATQFINELQALITHCQSVKLPGYTPSDFPLAKIEQGRLDSLLVETRAVSGREIEDIYPLSPVQNLFYAMDELNPAVGFEQWHFALNGSLNLSAFQEAWEAVIARHPILRSAFISEGLSEPHQLVYNQVKLPWTLHDWRDVAADEVATRIQKLLKAERAHNFDISQPPLMRLSVVQVAEERYHLIWSTHHLEIDGWSWPIIFQELSQLYQERAATTAAKGRQIERTPFVQPDMYEAQSAEYLDEIPMKKAPTNPTSKWRAAPLYRNYIGWLQQQDVTASESFWREALKGYTMPTALPITKTDTTSEIPFGEVDAQLSADHMAQLQRLAQQNQVTVNTLFQAAWALFLGGYAAQEEVVFGATLSGRPPELEGVESTVGPFVNNLPVRLSVQPEANFQSWLQALQAQQLELVPHQQTPLARIQSWSEVPLRYRLFDSIIVFQNYTVDESARRLGDAVEIETLIAPQATNYPLTIVGVPGPTMAIKLIYHTNQFSHETVTHITQELCNILEAMASGQSEKLSQLLDLVTLQTKTTQVQTSNSERKESKIENQKSKIEQTITNIWRDAFALEKIGLYDNFFDLGGHSVLIMAVHEQIQQALDINFPITKTFQHPTISALANYLGQQGQPQNGKPTYQEAHTRAQRKKIAQNRRKEIRKVRY